MKKNIYKFILIGTFLVMANTAHAEFFSFGESPTEKMNNLSKQEMLLGKTIEEKQTEINSLQIQAQNDPANTTLAEQLDELQSSLADKQVELQKLTREKMLLRNSLDKQNADASK